MNKYILITGSEGFIGKNVKNFFLSQNYKVIGIDKKKCFDKRKNFTFYKIDLKNVLAIKKKLSKFNIDSIVHLAAMPGIIDCNKNISEAFNDNILSTINIFNLSENLGIRKIFYFSSLSTYNFIKNPHIYALTKKFSQDIAVTQNKYLKRNSCCVNLSNVYGEFSENKNSFIHMMIKAEVFKKVLNVYNKGFQKRDFIYVGDIPKALNFLMKKKTIPYKFNLCTSKLINLLKVIKIYKKMTKSNIKIRYLNKQKNYSETKKMKSVNKSKGIKLTNLEIGLIKTRNFYIKNFKK